MAYPTDLTDNRWGRVRELLLEPPKRGRPYPDDLRWVVQPIPYAWRVAHARVGRHRRLVKSFENTLSSATAWVQVSCGALLLRHLAE